MTDFKQKLIADFPLVFRDKHCEISIGAGWESLVRDLCSKLEEIINLQQDKENFYAVQVKEKFGSLRFYLSCSTDEMEDRIERATGESAETCERCGLPGETTCTKPYNWIHVFCSICLVLYEKERL